MLVRPSSLATNPTWHRTPRFSTGAATRNSNLAVAEGGTILIRPNPGKLCAIIPEELNFGRRRAESARGGTRCVGRDCRGHRDGGRDAGLFAGPVRPPGAVRREGALDTARGVRHDSLCDAGSGRTASRPFNRDLLRLLGPGRALNRRGRRHQRAVRAAVFAGDRQRDRGLVGHLWHGLRAVFRSRFHSPAGLSRPRRFHRAGGLADHLRPDAALVCSG